MPAGHWGALGAKSWLPGEAVAAGVVAYSSRYTKISKSKNRILGTVNLESCCSAFLSLGLLSFSSSSFGSMETERLLHGQASSYSSPIVKFVVMSLVCFSSLYFDVPVNVPLILC